MAEGNLTTEYMVSVIIPTYNRAEQVADCVQSLIDSSYKNLEILVVDNASDDHTIALLRQRFDEQITIIALKENIMASGGRNEGIKHSHGDYILFLDNDNIVDCDMIERLVDYASRDSSIGLVGPITLQANDNNVIWTAAGTIRLWSSRPDNLYANKRLDEVTLEEAYPTESCPNCMMVSREAINAVGGFDTTYFAMYEEADFGRRIHLAGFKQYIVTSAITYHYETVAKDGNLTLRKLGAWPALRAYHFAKNRFVYMKKYATWYQRLVFYIIWGPLFTLYYTAKAIQCHEMPVAKAWVKGTFKGLFMKVDRKIKVEL